MAVGRLDSPHGVDDVAGKLPATLLETLESPLFVAPVLGGRAFRLVQQCNPPTMCYGDPEKVTGDIYSNTSMQDLGHRTWSSLDVHDGP